MKTITPGRPFAKPLFAVSLVTMFMTASPAFAATIIVTNTNDNGSGSLRQAVMQAASGDTIVFSSGVFSVPLTITLTSGPVEISKSLTINGAVTNVLTAPTINGNNITRTFQVDSGTRVTLSRLRITNGRADTGGGINNRGVLTVTGSFVVGNTATDSGGGIYNLGALNVIDTSIISNTSAKYGGGIHNQGPLTIVNSTLVSNTAEWFGGGIENRSTVMLTNSTLYTNNASLGGNLVNDTGVTTMTNTIIASSPEAYNCGNFSGGKTVDGGYNLEDSNRCGLSTTLHSLINTNPLVGKVQVNSPGLALPTLALLPGSPAIGAANAAACLANDERGVRRHLPISCDIGAFEHMNVYVPIVYR